MSKSLYVPFVDDENLAEVLFPIWNNGIVTQRTAIEKSGKGNYAVAFANVVITESDKPAVNSLKPVAFDIMCGPFVLLPTYRYKVTYNYDLKNQFFGISLTFKPDNPKMLSTIISAEGKNAVGAVAALAFKFWSVLQHDRLDGSFHGMRVSQGGFYESDSEYR